MSEISILLVDDNLLILRLATLMLSNDPRITIVGQAHTVADALEQIEIRQPHVVLMDICLPDGNGLNVTGKIKAAPHPPKVIVWTSLGSSEYAVLAAEAGADGFVSKGDIADNLLPLIYDLCIQRQQVPDL